MRLSRPGRAALRYADEFGWRVLPLHTPSANGLFCSCGSAACSVGKHPRTTSGIYDASNDPGTIQEWWSVWPDANIGLDLGRAGLAVLDVDGPEGEAAAGALSPGVPGDGPQVRTGRTGGRHVFFRGSVKNASLAARLDAKGAGGYVVLPPSRHKTGNLYTWERGPESPIPEWPDGWQGSRPAPVRDFVPALAAACAGVRMASPGRRNETLNRWAWATASRIEAGEFTLETWRTEFLNAAISAGLPGEEADRVLRRVLSQWYDKQRPTGHPVHTVEARNARS